VINTMPEETLRAFADHGNVGRSMEADLASAAQILTQAQRDGIDLSAITRVLEREGVRSFCDSYDDLLDCIRTKLGGAAA
jgi:transaldolase